MDYTSGEYIDFLKNVYNHPPTETRIKMVDHIMKNTDLSQNKLSSIVGCSQPHIFQLVYLSNNASALELKHIKEMGLSVSGAYLMVKYRVENDPPTSTHLP